MVTYMNIICEDLLYEARDKYLKKLNSSMFQEVKTQQLVTICQKFSFSSITIEKSPLTTYFENKIFHKMFHACNVTFS